MGLLGSMEPLKTTKEEAHDYSTKLKDMMRLMENTMETMYTYDALYNEINMNYDILSYQREEIEERNSEIEGSLIQGQTLIDEAQSCILGSENNLQVKILKFDAKTDKLKH